MMTWHAVTCLPGYERTLIRKLGRMALAWTPVEPVDDGPKSVLRPLLAADDEPSYVFLGFVGEPNFRAVRRTNGVIDWLRTDGQVRTIDQAIIARLRDIEAQLFAEWRATRRRIMRPGDRVKVRRSRKSKRARPARPLEVAAIKMRLALDDSSTRLAEPSVQKPAAAARPAAAAKGRAPPPEPAPAP